MLGTQVWMYNNLLSSYAIARLTPITQITNVLQCDLHLLISYCNATTTLTEKDVIFSVL